MIYEDKHPECQGKNGREAEWIAGVLCGIVLVLLLAFSVRRRTEVIQYSQQIETLTKENKELKDQVSELKEENGRLQKKADNLQKKADAYDDIEAQIGDLKREIYELFPDGLEKLQ